MCRGLIKKEMMLKLKKKKNPKNKARNNQTLYAVSEHCGPLVSLLPSSPPPPPQRPSPDPRDGWMLVLH